MNAPEIPAEHHDPITESMMKTLQAQRDAILSGGSDEAGGG